MGVARMIETQKPDFRQKSKKVPINEISTKRRHPKNELGYELEGPSNVTWVGDWEPNRKYVKVIHLKNKSLNLLKVKFTSPSTRTFSTPYTSQVIKLAAGSSKELPITFRPSEFIPYCDSIQL